MSNSDKDSATAKFLPYGRQLIDEQDIAEVVNVLRGDWLTTGPRIEAFEQAFAERVGASHAVVCSSGTTALHLATAVMDVRADQRVAVPSMTFLATANAVRYVGAEVLFVDVDAHTGLLDLDALQRAIDACEHDVRGVHVVHLAGQCADMRALAEFARERGLYVLEDACHSVGGEYIDGDGHHTPIGSCRYSDLAVFSLHPVKTLTMAEGGVITTNDGQLAQRMRLLRGHAMVSAGSDAIVDRQRAVSDDGLANPWYYEMQELGFNYRASDLHCALGLSQLARLDQFVEQRRRLVQCYDDALGALAPVLKPIPRVPWCRPAWHLYAVHIDFDALGMTRACLMAALRDKGIGTQVHYIPVHTQPYYARRYGQPALPGADHWYAHELSLPLHAGMTPQDVQRVVDGLTTLLGGVGG